MKKTSLLLCVIVLYATPALLAQDAAVEERLNRLNGLVQDLLEDKAVQKKQIESLTRELTTLREQCAQSNSAYATQDDLRRLAEKIKELDQKREADKELILKEIEKLAKTLAPPPPKPTKSPLANAPSVATTEQGYEYVIQPGDTLSAIVAAYRDKNIKVTVKQILQANPGLDEKRLQVGQKIFIPAPKS